MTCPSDEYLEKARAVLEPLWKFVPIHPPDDEKRIWDEAVARALREAVEEERRMDRAVHEKWVAAWEEQRARAERAEAALRDAKDAAGLPAEAPQADFCNAVRAAAAKVAVLERRLAQAEDDVTRLSGAVRTLTVERDAAEARVAELENIRPLTMDVLDEACEAAAKAETPPAVVPVSLTTKLRAERDALQRQLREAERERDEVFRITEDVLGPDKSLMSSVGCVNALAARIKRLHGERDEAEQKRDEALAAASNSAREVIELNMRLQNERGLRDEAERERDELRDHFRDWEASNDKVLSEHCPTDEQHCTCVPFLRKRIAEAERERDEALSSVRALKAIVNEDGESGWMRMHKGAVEKLSADSARLSAALALLREREWLWGHPEDVERRPPNGSLSTDPWCWTCALSADHGHAPDCRLAALLEEKPTDNPKETP